MDISNIPSHPLFTDHCKLIQVCIPAFMWVDTEKLCKPQQGQLVSGLRFELGTFTQVVEMLTTAQCGTMTMAHSPCHNVCPFRCFWFLQSHQQFACRIS